MDSQDHVRSLKTLGSATAASLTLLALAASTSANAEVTLYGRVDLGVVHESGGSSGAVTKLSSGAMSPSRLGVKANFDIGSGLTAKGQIETGYCSDSNNNPAGDFCTGGKFMGRIAKLGLEGSFGEVSFGRQFTLGYLNVDAFDPFGTGTAGQSTNLFSNAGLRANNSIIYTTPTMGGFTAAGLYAFGEVNGDERANRQFGASANYSAGKLAVGAAYTERRDAAAVATKDASLGASYDFGVATLYTLYQRSTGRAQALIGATVPVGPGTLMASIVRADDRSPASQDATQYGIGYTQAINKMLKAYVAYAQIKNKNGAGYVVGNATDDGSGTRAFNAGLVLSF